MYKNFIFLLIFLFHCFFFAAAHANLGPRTASLLKIQGAIGPATVDFVDRGIREAESQAAALLILQINTPGGLAKSMRALIQHMLNAKVPVVAYVAPSGARAASAGTYMVYAAQLAVMAPGTNLGAATPVALGGSGLAPAGDKDKANKEKKAQTKPQKPLSAAQKKSLNDALAYIRSLAQLRKRNLKWAEQAVLEGESISAQEALKLKVINFIAKDIPDLLQKINGQSVSLGNRSVTLNTSNMVIKEIVPDWRTRFLSIITDPSVAYILLMIGVYGIFFEFMSPGYVVPGVIGAISLVVGLYALALLPINYAGLALLLLGLAFIIAELFVPSFGVLGIGGAISFVVGSIFLMQTGNIGFHLPIATIVVVTLFTLLFMFLIVGMAIRSQRKPAVSGLDVLVGQHAVIKVAEDGRLWVRLHGESWQCECDVPVHTGQQVKVVYIKGLTLVVEPISKGE